MIRLELDVPPTTVDITINEAGLFSYYVRPLNGAVVGDIRELMDAYIALANSVPGEVKEPRGITVYRSFRRISAPLELREISMELAGSQYVH